MAAERDHGPILVVDDDRMMRAMARETLEREGYEVAEAADGEAALAEFERLAPGLMILDVEMPGLDGLSACSRIRRRHPDDTTPIVMVTASDDRASIDRAYECGATDFIGKPVNWDLLGHRVRYLLRASRAFREARDGQMSLAHAQRIARLGSWECDPATGEWKCSQQTLEILGLPPDETPSDYASFLGRAHPDERERVRDHIRESLRRTGRFEVAHRIVRGDGTQRHVEQQGEVVRGARGARRLSATLQDVTERRRAQEQIYYLANFDSLTGLANRRLFHEQLARAVAAARARGHRLALLYLDLDRFKQINDSLGHLAGDAALRQSAERIRDHVRCSDLVARIGDEQTAHAISRMGGDEFTVLLSKVSRPDDAAEVAQRILDAVAGPLDLEGHEISIGISIGIAIFPDDGDDEQTLLRNADVALYQAKESGRNTFKYFSPSMNTASLRKLVLQSRLREAMDRDEMRVHYQPRVALDSGRVASFEALLRWSHPDLGTVSPSEFIPLSEEGGLIGKLGEWVLGMACRQFVTWDDARTSGLGVSVNVSSHQLTSGKFFDVVARVLRETGLEPGRLELEITESALLEEDHRVLDTLHELRAIGVRIALDDFGTGYSALGYLTRFPIDTLKLDRSLISGLGADPAAAGIAGAVISMAHSLKLRVVAEGVAEEEQRQALRDLGCDEAQGFLYSSAVPAAQLGPLLAEWTEHDKPGDDVPGL